MYTYIHVQPASASETPQVIPGESEALIRLANEEKKVHISKLKISIVFLSSQLGSRCLGAFSKGKICVLSLCNQLLYYHYPEKKQEEILNVLHVLKSVSNRRRLC